jgi:acetyltransferase
MAVDRQFGPFLLFGQGGTGAEIIADKAVALPPLNLSLARELMSRTRVFRLLQGYRDRPAAALDAIALTLVQMSQLVCDLDGVGELDLNPLLADEAGVIVVDARIHVAAPEAGSSAGQRLAIRPYPRELERKETIAGVGAALLRPILPQDAASVRALVENLSPEDARLRFFTPLRTLAPAQLARLTQIDYDREMAFALFDEAGALLAVARLAADPDNRQAEFAIVVRSDLHRRGIGRLLMMRLIDYARTRHVGALAGDVMAENAAMLGLGKDLGFALQPQADAPGIVRLLLPLQTGGA